MANPKIRQDIWTLHQEQVWHPITRAYALAVREMTRRSEADEFDPIGWTYQAAVHGTRINPDRWRNQCQHFSWYFLPWHRMYLHYFERIVQSIIQGLDEVDDATKDAWSLPYWNYDRSEETRSLPPAFREELLDGEPNPLYREVRNERRGLNINAGDPLPAEATSARLALKETAFSLTGLGPGFGGSPTGWHHGGEGLGIAGALERTPHGDVHVEVGGLMGSFNTAGLDPIFWLHHANIDRLWVTWLKHHGGENPTDSRWLGMVFDFHDENRAEVTMKAEETLETTLLGYEYAEISPSAGPLEAFVMQNEPPPDQPAELVGATDEPMTLTGNVATARFGVSRPAGPLDATRADAPSRVYVSVENIQGEENPGVSYGVYVNVPDENELTDDIHHVGNLPFFGIELTQDLEQDHPGGHGGLRYVFDITDLYTRLRDEGRWDEERVTVTLAPLGLSRRRTAGPLGAEPEPEEETPPVTIGRVSLFYQ